GHVRLWLFRSQDAGQYRSSAARYLGGRLDRCAHRTFARDDANVFSVGVNLIAFQFRVFARGRKHDRLAAVGDLVGKLVSLFHGIAEEVMQHEYYKLIRMVVVVPEDDMIRRLPLWLPLGLCFFLRDRRHSYFGRGALLL